MSQSHSSTRRSPLPTRRAWGRGAGAAVVALVLAAQLGVPPAAATPDWAPAAAAPSRKGLVPLVVGSYNIRAGVSTGTFDRAVRGFVPRVHVAGLQEVNSRDKERALDRIPGIGYYRAPKPARQNPVVWKQSRFRFVSGRKAMTTPGRFIGREMPKRGSHVSNRYVTVVRLLDRVTGQRTSVINVHLHPGAVARGRRHPDRPLIYALFVREVAGVVEQVELERRWGRVYVLGDFNIGFHADRRERVKRLPFVQLKRLGLRSMWSITEPGSGGTGTHGRSLIDQVYADRSPVAASVLYDLGLSDHYPAVARYELPFR